MKQTKKFTTKDEVVNYYYENNAKRLRNLVYLSFRKFGGVYGKDHDEFYSDANLGFVEALEIWDGEKNFEALLQRVIINKTLKRISKINAYKRKADRTSISFDAPIEKDGESQIADFIASDFDIFRELGINNELDERLLQYFSKLNHTQRNILKLHIEGCDADQVKKKLKISNTLYEKSMKNLRTFEKIDALYESGIKRKNSKTNINHECEEEKMENSTTFINSEEKSKSKVYTVETLIRNFEEFLFRFDHPGQRYSEQWSTLMKSNLASDILQGNPVPHLIFAEQIIDGVWIVWSLDGKQRCTTCINFYRDAFKISPSVRRYNIPYKKALKNEDGTQVLNENGIPQFVHTTFDIRNKKYSQLPIELQRKFLEYNFESVVYLNCTTDDIMYHIERYNEGRAMNNVQKGVVKLGGEFAEVVKGITKHEFFKHENYTDSERNKGIIERIVMEGIMTSDFIGNWKSNPQKSAAFLRENATITNFESFRENIDILEEIVTKDIRDLFTSKETFIWIGLFARFRKTEEENERFVDFMTEFIQSLHSTRVDGQSYDDLYASRCTKDKSTVVGKINLLEMLMNRFLGLDYGEECFEDIFEDDANEMMCVAGNDIVGEEAVSEIEENANVEVVNAEEISEELPFEASENDNGNAIISEEMIREIKKCELFRLVAPEKARKIIIDTALLFNSDNELNTEEIGETIDFACNCFSDYSVEIPANSPVFAAENLPGAIYIVGIAIQRDVADSLIDEWMKRIHEICSDARTVGSFVDRAEMFKTRFDRFVEVKIVA